MAQRTGPRRQWTLRARLVAALLALATVAMAVFVVASLVLIHRSLLDRVDQQLSDFRPRLRVGPPMQGSGRIDDLPTDFRVYEFDAFGHQLAIQGAQTGESSGPLLPRITAATAMQQQRAPFTVDDKAGGSPWRVRVVARTDGTVTAVALSLDTTEATVQRLLVIELTVGATILLVLGAVAFAVVRIGLRPLTRIEHTAQQIAGGALNLRVARADERTETGRLGAALNTMLARISSALWQRQESEARLRRFVADASHELRTPLTSIRGFAELYRRGGATERADVDRMMGRIEDEAMRMGLLVEDLLLLARLDQERSLDLTEVDLTMLAEDAVHDALARDPDRPVTLVAGPEPVRVIADEHRMRQVLTNLVNNAVIHTSPGTPVRVIVGLRADVGGGDPPVAVAGARQLMPARSAVLEVVDEGAGIPVDIAPHVFDRFYRADAARSRKRGGTGLGLAITAAILEAHNGRVELRTAPGVGASFRAILPMT